VMTGRGAGVMTGRGAGGVVGRGVAGRGEAEGEGAALSRSFRPAACVAPPSPTARADIKGTARSSATTTQHHFALILVKTTPLIKIGPTNEVPRGRGQAAVTRRTRGRAPAPQTGRCLLNGEVAAGIWHG